MDTNKQQQWQRVETLMQELDAALSAASDSKLESIITANKDGSGTPVMMRLAEEPHSCSVPGCTAPAMMQMMPVTFATLEPVPN